MLARWAYFRLLLPLAVGIAHLTGIRNAKVRVAMRGRRTPRPAAEGGDGHINVLFHVSSLGEFEQARPIIEAWKRRRSDLRVWVSFFSPSGLQHAAGYPHVEDMFYLPLAHSDLRKTFDTIEPHVVVVIRFDLWPGLAWEASKRDVPVVMVDATLHPESHRNLLILRSLQRTYYRHLSQILTVSRSDIERLQRLCGPLVPIEAAGDSRYDRVWQRATASASLGSLDAVLNAAHRPLLVIGSTYEAEERVLAEALRELRPAGQTMSVVVVPHEPNEQRLQGAERVFQEGGWSPTRLSRLEGSAQWQMLLLDRVGVLAECYRHADFVMVGGSFKGKVHNVLEPAAWGRPIVVGPYYRNSPEAVGMVDSGGIRVVNDASSLAEVLRAWLQDAQAAHLQGARARDFLTSRLGSSERIAETLDAYLPAMNPGSPTQMSDASLTPADA